MAINLISVKCPECGANLTVEEEREFSFCTYCGTKVMLNNENVHIYRKIDEARLREAETDRMVAMRKLDMEEKSNISRKYLVIAWIAGTAILILLGIIGMSVYNDGLEMCLLLGILLGCAGGTGLFGNVNKKKKRAYVRADEAAITSTMRNYTMKNYKSIVLLYKGAGFAHVTAVPLNDLNLFNSRMNGWVDSVTINGVGDFEEGDVFPKASNVLITYHSR